MILVGLVAGWAAGKIMKGRGYGVLMDILLGIAGSLVGRLILGIFGLYGGGLVGSIVVATFGAVLLVWLVRSLKRA
jgi:uncharacterized membrane protein YeaQ/YmgE (transglycosylase-associated protein family)